MLGSTRSIVFLRASVSLASASHFVFAHSFCDPVVPGRSGGSTRHDEEGAPLWFSSERRVERLLVSLFRHETFKRLQYYYRYP